LVTEIFEKMPQLNVNETAQLFCLATLNQLRCCNNGLLKWKQNWFRNRLWHFFQISRQRRRFRRT